MKVYSNKSNAQRAARKFDVAQVVAVEGGWSVLVAPDAPDAEAPARDVNEDVAAEQQQQQDDREADFQAEQRAIDDAKPEAEPEVFDIVGYLAPVEEGAPDPAAIAKLDAYLNGATVEEAEAQVPEGKPEDVMMFLRVAVPAEFASAVALVLASKANRAVEIINPLTGNRVQLVEVPAKAARGEKQAAAGRPARNAATRDYTVKPIITSESNKALQRLMDKIEAARGDLANLEALDTFKRSSTYYKMAGRYIDALKAEARDTEVKPVGEEVGRIAA